VSRLSAAPFESVNFAREGAVPSGRVEDGAVGGGVPSCSISDPNDRRRGASMVEIRMETEITCPPERIFAAIVDLRGYDRWLNRSASFAGITDISSDPITTGTAFVESEPRGVRHGTIAELRPPTRVTFHLPMTMKPRLLGVIGIDVTYALAPTGDSTHLDRVVTLTIPWPLKLVQPMVVRQFRREGERTLLALKAFAETLH
jgi:uncharacterized protein YndB with AHSA1/START domain